MKAKNPTACLASAILCAMAASLPASASDAPAFDNFKGQTELLACRSVAQDSTGMIWFGTDRCLWNFDGHELQSHRADGGRILVNCILPAGGMVLFGCNDGLYTYDIYEDSVRRCAEPDSGVRTLVRSGGEIYAGTESGLFRIGISDGRAVPVKLTDDSIFSMAAVGDSLVLGTRDGLLTRGGKDMQSIGKDMATSSVVTALYPCADGILCEVSDNALGVGSAYLDPQHPQSIFQPGVSHWGRSQLPGLGLAVAKTIVQECQGRISAHNNEQGGLTVSWFLPSPAYEEANSGERIVEEAGGVIISSQPAVLIVEDEIMSFSMLRDYLESDGYYVEFARSGEECLQRLQEDKRQFDCILCDYNMPRMNGLELYQKVGEIDPKLQERFIFMTGYNVSNLLKTTGRKYLFKPLFKKELLEAVQACLEHSEEHHG